MKIAVDLRSLSSGAISGVENYTINLLENLLPLDKKNHYSLFYNAFSKNTLGDFHFINSTVKPSRLPNKLLNLALKFKWTSIEKLIGDFDCLFMPNLSQFNVSPRVKVVLTVHDLSPVVTPQFYNVKRRIWHKFLNYKKAFERANLLLAVSEYTKNDLIKIFGINPGKIKVVYPGVNAAVRIADERLREVRNTYNLPGEFILFLNTIEPRKNLANLIRAFERLKHPADLIIAGRLGWKYTKDFALIKKTKKIGKISYIGYVQEKDKLALIKLAKVLVYPSFYEGFGFQALEAMGVGTPVITSQLTAIPEVVGDAALLINPYDINSLHKALETVLDYENVRKELIAKALSRGLGFNWERTAALTLENLNNL